AAAPHSGRRAPGPPVRSRPGTIRPGPGHPPLPTWGYPPNWDRPWPRSGAPGRRKGKHVQFYAITGKRSCQKELTKRPPLVAIEPFGDPRGRRRPQGIFRPGRPSFLASAALLRYFLNRAGLTGLSGHGEHSPGRSILPACTDDGGLA